MSFVCLVVFLNLIINYSLYDLVQELNHPQKKWTALKRIFCKFYLSFKKFRQCPYGCRHDSPVVFVAHLRYNLYSKGAEVFDCTWTVSFCYCKILLYQLTFFGHPYITAPLALKKDNQFAISQALEILALLFILFLLLLTAL